MAIISVSKTRNNVNRSPSPVPSPSAISKIHERKKRHRELMNSMTPKNSVTKHSPQAHGSQNYELVNYSSDDSLGKPKKYGDKEANI
jgi:hypothetical protein